MTEPASDLPRAVTRLGDIRRDKAQAFELIPTAGEMRAIARSLQIDGLRKLRFTGALDRVSDGELRLNGHLGATVVQPCIITLAPVTTRIEAEVTRRYLAEMPEPDPEQEEVEMPEDETMEPLRPRLDLAEVMIEALALNLPLYPRAEGADLGEAVFAEPGVAPLRDEDTRPFAGLSGLRAALKDADPDDGGEDGGGQG